MNTPSHLGGHAGVTHVDIGALEYCIEQFGITTAVDVGCGVGDMVKIMRDLGLEAIGIEGDPSLSWGRPECFVRHDFTKGPLDIPETNLGWCVEVLEHIDEEFLDNVFSVFKNCRYVVVTASPPGTESAHHHVNCQDEKYWKNIFRSYGFRYKIRLTKELREASTMTRNFMRETGLVFENKKYDD